MGLFNFSKKKESVQPVVNRNENFKNDNSPGLVFEKDSSRNLTDTVRPIDLLKGIDGIYAFLQADYESRGYNDALISPDESYRLDNIKLFNQDLIILIERSKIYYEDMLKELDFHIKSRERAGLIDLVDVLKTRKEVVTDHLNKVGQINADLENKTGIIQRITLSYQRGFMRGLSALTQMNLLNKEY